MGIFYSRPTEISTAIETSRNEQDRYNNKETDGAKYSTYDNGSLFSVDTDKYKIEYSESGLMTRFETYDKEGKIKSVVSSTQNDDGSIEYYYDYANDDIIEQHEHYKFDKQGDEFVVTEHFTDSDNNGNYEYQEYVQYKDTRISSERDLLIHNKNGRFELDVTRYRGNGKEFTDIFDWYEGNDTLAATVTERHDENGNLFSTEYDNHYNDNILNRIKHPLGSLERDSITKSVYNADGTRIDFIDYGCNGTVDKTELNW